MSWYVSCRNNPIKYTDPDGMYHAYAGGGGKRDENTNDIENNPEDDVDHDHDHRRDEQPEYNNGPFDGMSKPELLLNIFLHGGLFPYFLHETSKKAIEEIAAGSLILNAGLNNPLVYGPSSNGALSNLAWQLGGQTLNDLPKPMEQSWETFTRNTLEGALSNGRPVVFDISNMRDIDGVLAGTAYQNKTTSYELRYIHSNWDRFRSVVVFSKNGVVRGAPW